MVPEISYLTIMDAFLFFVIFLQICVLVVACVAANLPDPTDFDRVSLIVLAGMWGCANIVLVLRCWVVITRRDAFVSACKSKFDGIFSHQKELTYSAVNLPSPTDHHIKGYTSQ
jgi:hypothetical protein